MKKLKLLKSRFSQHLWAHPAQAFVEFALALPILLMILFGVIEFGRLLQAWLALENGARFAVRYAVTGNFDVQYCAEAAATLGLTADDTADGRAPDCRVPETITDYELKSYALQDYARLPSIRDAAISGATGIAIDLSYDISGDYQQYVAHGYDTADLETTHRGNPSRPGYFVISTCSTRVLPPDGDFFRFDSNPFYYDPIGTGNPEDYRYPTYCELSRPNNDGIIRYEDDAGGPGDRVKVVLTFRHNLITPIINSWWPTLRLTSEREGLVEKFRTSRVIGLSGGIAYAPTWTPTALPATETPTPTTTLPPTITPTPTATATANCNDLQVSASNALLVSNNRLYIYLNNTSSLYNVTLTGNTGQWLETWHNNTTEARPAISLKEYGWDSGGYSVFYPLPTAQWVALGSPPVTWNHNFGTTKVISAGWSGNFAPSFSANFSKLTFTGLPNFNYYHGSDFSVSVRFNMGGTACTRTVTGLDGPVVNPTVIWSGSGFAVDANASAVRGVSSVYFKVFNSLGTEVHSFQESTAKYCLFGGDNPCTINYPYINNWNGGSLITNGTYTVSIIAVDAGSGNYATRRDITVVVAASTPTVTRTMTITPTRTITRTPTQTGTITKTPTRTITRTVTQTRTITMTRTITKTPTKTNTRTITPTRTITRTPTKTYTVLPTATPTTCQTPIEMGGCQ